VLQVEESLRDVLGTPAEWTRVRTGYEAAVDYLDRRGLVDRQRVGIVG
jgi:dienelactone hydrolase